MPNSLNGYYHTMLQQNKLKEIIATKLKTMSLWRLVMISVIFSEMFTLIIVSLMSVLFRGDVTADYVITGITAAFFVSLVVVSIIAYLIKLLRETDKLLEAKSMQLKELNLKLEDSIKEEVRKNREKDRLAFEQSKQLAMSDLLINLAHHWRQPLNAIGVLTQDTEDMYMHGQLNKEYLQKNVKLVMKELFKLSDTIKAFDEIYHPSGKKMDFSISKAVDKTIYLMSSQIKECNISIEKEIKQDILITVNPYSLSQVLIQILANSIENFREKNMENRNITIIIYEDNKSEKAVLKISDNGGGIEEEIFSRVFDPYFTTKYKSREKGLGLYIVKNIVEMDLKGTLTVKNSDIGVSFTIEV